MGNTKGRYNPEFPTGSMVRVASRDFLKSFLRTWKYHNPLLPKQLEFANTVAKVGKVFFYHGGDELYQLEGIPGNWHEQCLGPATREESHR
jgi:hypothetical protein